MGQDANGIQESVNGLRPCADQSEHDLQVQLRSAESPSVFPKAVEHSADYRLAVDGHMEPITSYRQ